MSTLYGRSWLPRAGARLVVTALIALSTVAYAAREGDVAPDFQLPDTMNELVSLKDYAGNPAVVVFYRGFF